MNPKDPGVDQYFVEGCGRCELGGTPDCKVHNWQEELQEMRRILLECGLTEELKWSAPCYTYQGNNILMMSALKNYASIGFFKGSLLKDERGLLKAPGKNSQAVRQFRFTDIKQVIDSEQLIKSYVFEAIEVEKAGLKVDFKKISEIEIPEELAQSFEEDPALEEAFKALTPGRQRGYILYFSAPKQAKTKFSRIEKYRDKILSGKGFHDR